MLQIRLSKGPLSDGGGSAARPTPPLETVTVACSEHLVIADLPVAKSVGAVTASAAAAAAASRNISRRSRRQLGDRIHFCVRCDFPIAIYGRLIPCEHAFCLACARNDPSCYLCDERVQKIQTIKMLEGIFICAAPHCLKSFLKKAEFESHVHEIHADLLQPNAEKEGGNENNTLNVTKASSADLQKQSSMPEASTARAPLRSGFSPSSNSQPQDREDRPRRLSSRDQPPPRPQLPLRPPPFHSFQPHQPGDFQVDGNPPQVSDRPYNWFPQPQRFDSNQGSNQYQQDSDQFPSDKSAGAPTESLFPNYATQLPQQSSYPMPVNPNQHLMPAPFNFPPFPADGSQNYYGAAPYEMLRPESAPSEGGPEQGSVLGNPQASPGMANFAENYPRPWGIGLVGMPFQPMTAGQQGIPEGFANPADSHGGIAFFQSDYGQSLLLNPLSGKELEHHGGSGNQSDGKVMVPSLSGQMQSSMPLPPPPPLPPTLSHQLMNRVRFSGPFDPVSRDGQGIGWQSDKGRFGNGPD